MNREKSSDLIAVKTLFEIEIEIELGSHPSRVNGSRSARIGETSIQSLLLIQILVIDLDWTRWNEAERSTVWRLGISIHHSIIQYQTRKSYKTSRRETTIFRSEWW